MFIFLVLQKLTHMLYYVTQVSTEDRSAEAAQHLEKAALLTARTHQVTTIETMAMLLVTMLTLPGLLVDETFSGGEVLTTS